MAIHFITNTVAHKAVNLLVTDDSDVETSDFAKIGNITKGARHLTWTQDGTDPRRLVYIRETEDLEYDTVVLANASDHNTHSVKLLEWAKYAAGSPTERFSSSNFAETLTGKTGKDWVYDAGSQSGLSAIGIEFDDGTGGAYAKTVNKFFVGKKTTLARVPGVEVSPLPLRSGARKGVQRYEATDTIKLEFSALTDAEIDAIQSIFTQLEEPFFIYDDSADKKYITDGLLYVVRTNEPIDKVFDDFYNFTIELAVLRYF